MNAVKEAKLSGIFLENFQSLRDPVFFQINKLCFFYGPNSSGKSAIHDALYLIKETLINEPDWNFINLYGKYGASFSTKIGLEFIAGKFGSQAEESLWKNTPTRYDDYEHISLFKYLENKKIQVEISSLGDQIKVAVNGKPLFEILDEYTYFNNSCKKVNFDELDPDMADELGDSEYQIRGKLVIYKKTIEDYFSLCSFSDPGLLSLSSSNKSIYTDIFYEDYPDKQIINGIFLRLGSKELTTVDDVCYRIISGDFFDSEEYENAVSEFHINSGDPIKSIKNFKSNNNSILYLLENLTADYSKVIKGLIFQIINSLNYSHIKGDRQILDSKHCISYESNRVDTFLNLKEKKRDDTDPLKIYAKSLLNKNYTYWIHDKPKFNGDFINYCLSKYISSLKEYEVIPKIFHLHEQGSKSKHPNNTLIYLFIKNKIHDQLGFQDVGSGISYVLPILASIWCRNISFIEQPELHLHPKAQCEIADAFICSTFYGNSSIIESHSEHLLLRVSRRIRETTQNYLLSEELKLNCNDVTIYYFDPQPDGTTKVKNIRMDRYGELLDVWPGGFFSERDDELFS